MLPLIKKTWASGFEAILLPGCLLCTAHWHSRLRGRGGQWQEGGPGPRGTVAGTGEGNRDGHHLDPAHSHAHSLGKQAATALRQSERLTPKSLWDEEEVSLELVLQTSWDKGAHMGEQARTPPKKAWQLDVPISVTIYP